MNSINPIVLELLLNLDRYLFGRIGDTKEWVILYNKSLRKENVNPLSVDISFLFDCVKCEWISYEDYTKYVVASMFFRNKNRHIVRISPGKHMMVPDCLMCEDETTHISVTGKHIIVEREDYQKFWQNFVKSAA